MKLSVYCVFKLLVSLIFVVPADLQLLLEPGDFCIVTKTGFPGWCVSLKDCPSALEEVNQQLEPQLCGYQEGNGTVCCPDPSVTGLTRAEQKCRDYANEIANLNLYGVVSEKDAVIQEFPHMAALGYGNKNDIKWKCAGSLISHQFVLTSAHCLYARELGAVVWVRLGDLDLDTGSDVKRDYQIIRRIFHPDYKPPAVYNDIGLIELEIPVQFSLFVRPACLFQRSDVGQYIDLISSGWGLAQFGGDLGSSLQKIYIEIFTSTECTNTYRSISNTRRLPSGIKHEQQFCAGSRGPFEKNTCLIDSGGPLQTYRYSYSLYGIVGVSSFGKACGVPNVPGVFTRVSNYVSWIEDNVWPELPRS